MVQMTGGELLVQSLAAHGVEVVFGVPGLHTLAVYDALYGHPQIRTVVVRHEASAAFMADGYARATGRPGVCLCIPGPGVANALAGLGEAFGDSSPVLLIAGQIDTTEMGRGRRVFHEYHHQSRMIDGVVAWRCQPGSPEEIPGAVADAFRAMLGQSPQPAVLEIPRDVAGSLAGAASPFPDPLPRLLAPVPGGLIERAATMLRQAKFPMLLAGQGVVHASATGALVALAEALQAPVLTTSLGRSAFPEDHPLSVGYQWAHTAPYRPVLAACDLLFAIGTDLGEKVGLGTQISLPPKLMHLDIRAGIVGRHYATQLGMVGDAAEVLPRLVSAVAALQPTSRLDVHGLLRDARTAASAQLKARGPLEYSLVRTLRETLPADAIIALDAALINDWLNRAYTVYEPRTCLTPSSSGTLGFALPAALGAKVALPARTVVAIVGDGGFLFTAQELATAKKYGLGIIVVLFNDDELGTIRYFQERQYQGRIVDTALYNPDFLAFARSFACDAIRARDAEALRLALLQAMDRGCPTVIEVPIAVRYPAWVEQE